MGTSSGEAGALTDPSGRRPRLIHLNGPSRIGKSTLARRYADEHPGVLVLDIDVVTGLVGGARRDFLAAQGVARDLARDMARHHLGRGLDVVLPQLFTVHDTDEPFDVLARDCDAGYVEIVLLADRRTHRDRVRATQPRGEVEETIQRLLEDPGSDLLERIDEHLAHYLETRPRARRLDTSHLGVDEAYRAMTRLLD